VPNGSGGIGAAIPGSWAGAGDQIGARRSGVPGWLL